MQEIIIKFIKFGVVGASGVIIDFSLTYLLKEKLKINKYISNSLGFLTAASTNYILNRIWTFENNDPQIVLQYSKFLMVSIFGLVINNIVIYYLNDKKSLNFYLSKAIAILFVMFWNFGANYIYTF